MTEVERRKMAAYWYAVGVYYEQCRMHRLFANVGRPEPVDLSNEFAEWYQQQAEAYVNEQVSFLSSVPGAWDEFAGALMFCAGSAA